MRALPLVMVLAMLAACDSGQGAGVKTGDAQVAAAPGDGRGSAYPSQTGRTATMSPGANGGRGSAATGASDPASSSAAGAETNGGGSRTSATTATPP